MFVALSPGCCRLLLPLLLLGHDRTLRPVSPTIEPHRLLSFSFSPSPLPPREDKIADYFVPLPVPRVSSDAALSATPPYSTHYATLDYTNFRLSLSLSAFVFYILSLSLVSSLFLLALRASVSLASIHVSFMIPLPPAASSVSLARLHRGKHDRHSDERITQTRLRRVLCSFRQFNVTMSHERPIVRSDCQFVRLLHRDFLEFCFTIPPQNSD